VIALSSSQLRVRSVNVSDAELVLRAAAEGEPYNAHIALARGEIVRVWLIDAERKALGMRVAEPTASALSFGMEASTTSRPRPAPSVRKSKPRKPAPTAEQKARLQATLSERARQRWARPEYRARRADALAKRHAKAAP
jgi:hypothetical protein